ncbi:IclR family transcriptional regulator domain-containing protein [Phytohabitans suffuscus]|uniref:HTH iclR-type domain-containing protein n=1 Tax=Phytohabitans suffuscus TaxID=624315 RepID=A0A6F8YZ61_9ACTN|nr:IclR family transcriptional regulator C-terminal domain-containing protein [Phytohabitans suffuscus]BCB91218.1 hypothetical protein Psuf_085310 [Phytohabitans suffuscus]
MAGRSVTLRALSVLDAFGPAHRRLNLSEIAHRADLPLATAHRHVRELVDWHALERREDGTYQIGPRLWHLGLLSPMHADLREVALPHTQDLCAATSDTVHLAVRDGARALYVERLGGVRSVRVVSRPGGLLPLHATGVGKVLLAWAPPQVRREALAGAQRLTPHTVVDPARLAAQLSGIRRTGVAWTREEMALGASSLAVAVRGPGGGVVAAVGLVVPSTRPHPATGLRALRRRHHRDRRRARRPGIGWDPRRVPVAGSARHGGASPERSAVVAHDRATALSVQLTLTHQALRERLSALRQHLLSGSGDAPPTGSDPLRHCAAFCTALRGHHTGEDEGLLPALRREFPELAPTIDKLAEDHWLLAGILRRVEELAASAASVAVVVGELDGLAAIMDSHFAFEERRIAAAVDGLKASRDEVRAAQWSDTGATI